ncbi:MAG: hypothetical protein ACRCX2_13595 [Paraclostridium sp.]
MNGKLGQVLKCLGVNSTNNGGVLIFKNLNFKPVEESKGIDILLYLYSNLYDNLDILSDVVDIPWSNDSFNKTIFSHVNNFIADQIEVDGVTWTNLEAKERLSLIGLENKLLIDIPKTKDEFIIVKYKKFSKLKVYNTTTTLLSSLHNTVESQRTDDAELEYDLDASIFNLSVTLAHLITKRYSSKNTENMINMWAKLTDREVDAKVTKKRRSENK